jgi:hypothetical protein
MAVGNSGDEVEEAQLKRSLKHLAAVGTALALMAVAAPAASAAPEDAPGCTTVYVGTLLHLSTPEDLVTVTYTPPSTVTVSADPAIGVVQYVAGATVTYIDCVV